MTTSKDFLQSNQHDIKLGPERKTSLDRRVNNKSVQSGQLYLYYKGID